MRLSHTASPDSSAGGEREGEAKGGGGSQTAALIKFTM